MESWENGSDWAEETATVAPGRDQAVWEPYHIIEALRALGVLKPGERPVVRHRWDCPFPKDPLKACTCPPLPGSNRRVYGAEIFWPDYDELTPRRNYNDDPPRFYEHQYDRQ